MLRGVANLLALDVGFSRGRWHLGRKSGWANGLPVVTCALMMGIACQFGCLLAFCLLEWDRKRAPQEWQGKGCPRTCGNSKMHGSQKMRTKAMLVVSLLMTSKGMPVQCVVFGAMQVPCAFIYYCMNLVGGVLAFSHQIWMGTVRHAASVSKRLGEELRV